ncbi:MAG: hypothetical protein M3325_09095 [Actinomycetota bacterium]|nr:hypothetical protein [Actinomycetota bacterium]
MGTDAWRITGTPPGVIDGFADRTYAAAGDTVSLAVSTDAPQFRVEAYRMGYYQGRGARLVWYSDRLPGVVQPPCPVAPRINMVSCGNWSPSLQVEITAAFVPGDYLAAGATPGPLRITDAQAWIFTGTGLHDGEQVPGVIGSDVDSLDPQLGFPPNVAVFAHSPLDASHAQARTRHARVFYSDMTYYTDPASQAGVWDSGTNAWIPDLNPCPGDRACPAAVIGRITGNLLQAFGAGPAGLHHPSEPNWQLLYPAPASPPHGQ